MWGIIWSPNTFRDIFLTLVTFVEKLWEPIRRWKFTSPCIMLWEVNPNKPLFVKNLYFLSKDTPRRSSELIFSGFGVGNPRDFEQFIVALEEGRYGCAICKEFTHKCKHNVKTHVEAKHFKGYFSYSCDICGATSTTMGALATHKSRHHKKCWCSNKLGNFLIDTFHWYLKSCFFFFRFWDRWPSRFFNQTSVLECLGV